MEQHSEPPTNATVNAPRANIGAIGDHVTQINNYFTIADQSERPSTEEPTAPPSPAPNGPGFSGASSTSTSDCSLSATVPGMLRRHVARTELMERVRSRLVPGARVGLWGMGGAGKTTLAAMLARDAGVQEVFDRIVWVAVTRQEEPAHIQERALRLLDYVGRDGKPVHPTSIQDGQDRLTQALSNQLTLLVLDDVWDVGVLQALDVPGTQFALLLTTRNKGIAASIDDGNEDDDPPEVAQLEMDQALTLLGDWTKTPVDQLPPEADSLCIMAGCLALGVALVGGMVNDRKGQTQKWQKVLSLLEVGRGGAIESEQRADHYQYSSVEVAISVSIDDLDPAARDRYRELAVFAGRGGFPDSAVNALWAPAGLNAGDANTLLTKFINRSLVQTTPDERYTLHDLEFDVATKQLSAGEEGIKAAHQRLLEGYKSRTHQPLADCPDDAYLPRNLAFHLAAAQSLELNKLLVSFAWMERRLAEAGISDLLIDYSHYTQGWPSPTTVETVHGALQLSAAALADDPDLLAGQLIGRLLDDSRPKISALLSSIRRSSDRPWLCPRTPESLTGPGGPLTRTLLGHVGRVTTVAVTTNGRYIVTGSDDRTVKVWVSTTGHLERTIPAHNKPVTAVAVTVDGLRIVSGSADRTVKVWILDGGREQRDAIPAGHVYAVAVADDDRIVVGGGDKDLQVWTWTPQSKWLDSRLRCGHSSYVKAVAAAAEGRYLVSGSDDGSLCVWDLNSDNPINLPRLSGAVEAVAISADGRYVVAGGSDGTVRAWNLYSAAPEVILSTRTARIHAVAITSDGKHVLTAGQDQIVRVWDPATNEVVRELPGHTSDIEALAITRDDRYLISGSHDRTVRVWDLTVEGIEPFGHDAPGEIRAMAFSADGRCLVWAGDDQPISVRDLPDGAVRHPLNHVVGHGDAGSIKAAALSPDGQRLICAGYAWPFSVWDLSTGQCLHIPDDAGRGINAIAVCADNRYVVTGGSDKIARLWTVRHNGTLDLKLKMPDQNHNSKGAEVYAVAITPDARWVVTGGHDKIVRVWDAETGEQKQQLPSRSGRGHRGRITALAVTSDSQYIVSAGHDKDILVWRIGHDCPVRVLEGDAEQTHTLAITADDKHLISGGSDNAVRLWDLARGQELAHWVTDAVPVTACVAHPTDRWSLAYGDGSGRVAILSLRGPSQK
ncbi:NB-ARC domain-containing protein [Nocardia yunnanensis]|nr:NB-ARC domain-containing protein [Nocardia yunnanensis]